MKSTTVPKPENVSKTTFISDINPIWVETVSSPASFIPAILETIGTIQDYNTNTRIVMPTALNKLFFFIFSPP